MLEARIRRNPWNRKVQIAILDDSHSTSEFLRVAQPVIMHDRNINEEPSPAFELEDEAAQLLLDELWRAGFRPTEGVDNAGQLKATQNHLGDMKKIAFDMLGIVGPMATTSVVIKGQPEVKEEKDV